MKGKLILGIIFVVVGAILIIVGPSVYGGVKKAVNNGIDKSVVISGYSDDGYLDWTSNGQEGDAVFYRDFYILNLTNPEAVINGAAPIVQELGPYSFHKISEKIDVVFNEDDTVAYTYYTHYHFLADLSNGTLSDKVTNVNMGYLAVVQEAGSEQNLEAGFFPTYLAQLLNTLETSFVDDTFLPGVTPVSINLANEETGGQFLDAWVQGVFNPYFLPLNANYSTEIPAQAIEGLFDPTVSYSLVDTSFSGLWLEALKDSAAATFLQSYWGIPADAQVAISTWYNSWSEAVAPSLVANLYGVGVPTLSRDLAYLQFATLNLTKGASLHVLSPTTATFYVEYAAFTTYVLGTPSILSFNTTAAIFNSATGFLNVHVWGEFLIALGSGATDFSSFGFADPQEAFLFYEYSKYVLQNTLYASFSAGGGLFTTQTVQDYIFGFENPLLTLISPTSGNTAFFTNDTSKDFAQANELPEGRYTGNDDISKVGKYYLFNDAYNVSIWASPEFFEGGDASQNVPRYNKDDLYVAFSDTLMRNIHFRHGSDYDFLGITLNKFSLAEEDLKNFTNNPTNAKYYYYIDGVHNFTTLNVGGVSGLPIFLTKPHFLDVDPLWANRILYLPKDGVVQSGMSPTTDLYDTFVGVEPNSGATMQAHQRIQFNIMLTPGRYLPAFNITQEQLLPVYWIHEHSELTPTQASDFKTAVYDNKKAGVIIVAVLTPIGGVLLIAGIILIVITKLKQQTNEIELDDVK